MNTKRFMLCVCFAAISMITAFGQIRQKNKPNSKSEIKISIDSLQTVIDSLKLQLSKRDSTIENNNMAMEKHNIYVSELRDSFSIILEKKDKRIQSFRDSSKSVISIRDKELSAFRANSEFVDTWMAKLANEQLYRKYNKTDVDAAITRFDKIYSASVRNEYSIVQKLLRNYESSYCEFKSILQQAQSDNSRTNPFDDAYKEKYIRKIKDMFYYNEYYDSDWNIRYLNEKIAEALKCLNSHSDKSPADFTLIIENL
jgi:hypothetical protein